MIDYIIYPEEKAKVVKQSFRTFEKNKIFKHVLIFPYAFLIGISKLLSLHLQRPQKF